VAAELKKNQGQDVKLTKGSKGIFDVLKDGKTIFSKYQSGRFPEEGEITDLLKAAS
jgi:selenoprotein W-related protein